MGNFRFRLIGTALLLASAGCIVDRDAVRTDSPRESAMPPPDRTPPPSAPPASNSMAAAAQASAAMNDPAPTPTSPSVAAVKERAAAADADRANEEAIHSGGAVAPAPDAPPAPSALAKNDAPKPSTPTITNLDADGNKMTAPSPYEEDDSDQEGAPGANASSADLAKAWPGSAPAGDADGDIQQPPMGNPSVTNDTPPPPGTEVDPAQFQAPLRSYGRWVVTPEYGRVWVPYVESNWQPYSDGTWVNTDYGWTFTSYDPWGWAVWHYGNWGFRRGIGWYWVPGRVWGPAWVSWRWGGGYACWRPVAPWGVWGARWGTRGWVSVPQAHFTEPIRGVAIQRAQVSIAVAGARPLPGPVAHPVVGAAFGPRVNAVARVTGHPVVARPAAQVLRENNIAARSAAAQAGRAGAAQSEGRSTQPQPLARNGNVQQGQVRTRPNGGPRQRGPGNRANGNGRPGGGARANGAARGGGHGGHGGGGHGGGHNNKHH